MKVLYSLAGAALLLAAAGSASAQEARIRYGDLDLGTGRGAATFDARVDAAAERLCRHSRRPGSLISDRAYCREATRNVAVDELPRNAQADYARGKAALEI
ncbi:UrcA family protein [Brevundimonas sp. Root1279]|uniref:UrcA family protein n=1 Tax=Brevundimonas sp. Root1279 TaxID=1736443 RepID=UPI0006FA524B|nr:UrcA family protein [Brevundimonas sp. Root1279]KQW86367.1 hypothetical protein ASC65_00185 [Brevundimonas sp. Root1279]